MIQLIKLLSVAFLCYILEFCFAKRRRVKILVIQTHNGQKFISGIWRVLLKMLPKWTETQTRDPMGPYRWPKYNKHFLSWSESMIAYLWNKFEKQARGLKVSSSGHMSIIRELNRGLSSLVLSNCPAISFYVLCMKITINKSCFSNDCAILWKLGQPHIMLSDRKLKFLWNTSS